MATPENDFDAAKAVVDQLKGLDKERQQRVLRWVAESLNLELPATPTLEHSTRNVDPRAAQQLQPHVHEQVHQVRNPSTDIKTFADSKQPKTDVQFAAVVAYYYRFEASPENRQDSINALALQEAARLAGRRRPPNALKTLNNAKQAGYLDSVDRGQFRINSVGENLVAMTLPGTGLESAQRKSRPPPPKAKKR